MSIGQSGTASEVVGVALPVPSPWGEQIQELRVGYGEERAQQIPTHITLLPPTPLGPDQLDPLRAHLEQVAASLPPFDIVLRGTGTFRPISDVVYLQVARGVSSCERLERAVRTGPVERELSFPYHPHVTLAHDLEAHVLDRAFEDLAGFTASYTADFLRLYLHHGDGMWDVVDDFALTGHRAH
ncbi:2'-5' RNA ligase family protein [Ornithinimicrobium panacihumi]|uniref:2'-5' RNA ligase family protein n=1 Tax=Ornithinimicrobium panacihumi TaxID=2008449 RepID=UPI003F8C34E8